MRNWDLLDAVRAKATQPELMVFRSYRDGQVLHRHPLGPGVEAQFGSPHLLIHRKEMLQILVRKARDSGVRLETDSQVVDIDLAARSVTTARGQVYTADLIVGADGERSRCRSVILGRPDVLLPTGKLVYRFTIDVETARRQGAEMLEPGQVLDSRIVTCWMGPGTHVVMYPLLNNGVFHVAVNRLDPIEGRVQHGPREADLAELACFFAGWDPVLTRLLGLAKDASYWTLLQLPEESRVWTDSVTKSLVLVGDAAHAMVPFL